MIGAHRGKIRGIAAASSNNDEYVSCGQDRRVLIWDERQALPALKLCDGNVVDFSAIYWSTADECNEQVFVGDISGNMTVLDPRVPKNCLLKKKVATGAINSLVAKSKKIVVNNYSRSTIVCELKSGAFETIYADASAPNHVTSAAWSDDDTFWTVGWNNFVKKHVLTKD